ncbi:MAG: RsmB/NOP family class I SAM-dependent RNA methyltransferase [Limnohabitans sp.]|jgi:16S rRNA (cytosine967-C5)-methyltransferase|nr:RsmB/NOP family class I SAM-dependent RNA methyltransferase [Limnohabitans sp.]
MHPKALLDACTELTRLLLRFDHPADSVVSKYFRDQRKQMALGPRERGVLAETGYNVLRQKLRFEHLAKSGSGVRERRLAILGWATYLDSQAKLQQPQATHGDRGFMKAAMSEMEFKWLADCDAATDEAFLAPHRHNLPPWLAEALEAQLGEDFWPLVDSLQHTAGLDVRVNTLQAKRADVQAELEKNGIAVVPTPFSPWGLRMNAKPNLSKLTLFEKGVIEVQDEGSQLLALLLDAKRGEMVADFCAGAGGKTLALGAAMRNTGRLYAFDTSAHRLEAMKPRLARSGLSNIHPVAIAHERDDRIKRLRGKMDRVLVDAPCTGLGTLRRNPDLKWRQTPEAVAELTVKQAAILASAARLLKPGGRLVYATCSLLPAENEEIAQAFSAAHPNFKPLLVKDLLTDFEVSQPENLCTPDGLYLRLWPHRHGTDGFFAAAWAAA